MYNRVTLIGRLAADPELRHTQDGVAVVTFRLAVNRPKRTDGQQEADFIPCVAFRKLAVTISEYCKKGRLVLVEGSLRQRQYETQSGEKRTTYDVLAGRVQFLPDGRRQEGDGEAEPAPNDAAVPATSGEADTPPWDDTPMDIDIDDDDLPF